MSSVVGYVGMNFGELEWTQEQAIDAYNYAFEKYGVSGCTINTTIGYWNGTWETSHALTMLNIEPTVARDVLEEIMHCLAQIEVAWSIDGIDMPNLVNDSWQEERAEIAANVA